MKSFSLVILFLVMTSISCKRTNEIDYIDSYKVISMLIDNEAYALPPPPPPPNNSNITKMNNSVLDSVKNIKLKIGVYPLLHSISKKYLKYVPEDYKKKSDLVQINLKEISSRKDHELILSKDSNSSFNLNQDYNLLFRFSNIYYNSKNDKALVELIVNYGKNDGHSSMYLLSKKQNEWVIDSKKELEIR